MCRLSVTMRQSMSALIHKRRVKEIIVFLTVGFAVFTHSLTINKIGDPDIIAKTRVELRPITINAFLYDIIRVSAPVIKEEAVYYIYKPNGDAMKLDISAPNLRQIEVVQDAPPLVARFFKHMKPIIHQENNYDVFRPEDLFDKKLKNMDENEFMIGPLTIEDHGNWVLSVYTKDINDDWIEVFQVISVTIIEYVPLTISTVSPNSNVSLNLDSNPPVHVGDTVIMSIAFPIPDLETCELVAPRSTFDRFYDRNRIDMANCEFSIPNVTMEDAGIWKIIAVGKIVHDGEIKLDIIKQ